MPAWFLDGTRWIGLVLFLASLPTFVAVRNHHSGRTSKHYHIANTLALSVGIVGFCLFLFGGWRETLIFLAVWAAAGWLYNR